MTYFLRDKPDENCAKGGAVFGQALRHSTDIATNLTKIGATNFMSFHSILKTSADYYEAMRSARSVSSNITKTINARLKESGENRTVQVFPYSIFYVFYEQYLTMWPDTLRSLGISLLAIFVVTFLFMGLDLYSSIIVVVTIAMIVADIGGLMYLWNISLNAISLVNLVMASIAIYSQP